MSKGYLYAISIAARRGELKQEVPEAQVVEKYGIEGDGHAGDWDRQVTCLRWESVVQSNATHRLEMGPGDFAENLLIAGLNFSAIKAGSRLQIGEGTVLEVSQVGKEDHPSVVTRTFGVSLLPVEGLFCRVIAGGKLKKGDSVTLIG